LLRGPWALVLARAAGPMLAVAYKPKSGSPATAGALVYSARCSGKHFRNDLSSAPVGLRLLQGNAPHSLGTDCAAPRLLSLYRAAGTDEALQAPPRRARVRKGHDRVTAGSQHRAALAKEADVIGDVFHHARRDDYAVIRARIPRLCRASWGAPLGARELRPSTGVVRPLRAAASGQSRRVQQRGIRHGKASS
jgi:hypothetical protein